MLALGFLGLQRSCITFVTRISVCGMLALGFLGLRDASVEYCSLCDARRRSWGLTVHVILTYLQVPRNGLQSLVRFLALPLYCWLGFVEIVDAPTSVWDAMCIERSLLWMS
jgi:hypothetical protein